MSKKNVIMVLAMMLIAVQGYAQSTTLQLNEKCMMNESFSEENRQNEKLFGRKSYQPKGIIIKDHIIDPLHERNTQHGFKLNQNLECIHHSHTCEFDEWYWVEFMEYEQRFMSDRNQDKIFFDFYFGVYIFESFNASSKPEVKDIEFW